MITGVYPGSFDPLTKGHLDIILRSSKVVDKLYIAVLINNTKKNLFSIEERVQHLKKILNDTDKVEVITFSGLLAEFVVENKIDFIIKGVRNINDFQDEYQMATAMKLLDNKIETLFLPSSSEYGCISSSIVKQVAFLKGDISKFVPESLVEAINEKYDMIRSK